MLPLLLGFFFYQSIIRKDLLNKLLINNVYGLPKLKDLILNFQVRNEICIVSSYDYFFFILRFEFLGLDNVVVTNFKDIRLDYFTIFKNFTLMVKLHNDIFYSLFFINVYFLWFKSLQFVIEDLSKINLYKLDFQNLLGKLRTSFGELPKVEFFRYKFPKYLKLVTNTQSSLLCSIWSDLNFCVFLPYILGACTAFQVRFVFNTKSFLYSKILLSGFRFYHRIR